MSSRLRTAAKVGFSWPRVTLWSGLTVLGLLWLCLLFVFPFIELATHTLRGQRIWDLVGLILEPAGASLVFALVASFAAVVLGLPVAIVIAAGSRYVSSAFAAATLGPLFVNLLLRVYALRYMALSGGPLESLFEVLGWKGPLYGSTVLMLVGLTYLYLPFAVIPMAVSLSTIDRSAVEAGVVLGLGRTSLFRAVALGPVLRGSIAGLVLTLVPAFGDYLAPSVLGGRKEQMLASYLYDRSILGGDISTGALGVLLLWILTVMAMLVASWVWRESGR